MPVFQKKNADLIRWPILGKYPSYVNKQKNILFICAAVLKGHSYSQTEITDYVKIAFYLHAVVFGLQTIVLAFIARTSYIFNIYNTQTSSYYNLYEI